MPWSVCLKKIDLKFRRRLHRASWFFTPISIVLPDSHQMSPCIYIAGKYRPIMSRGALFPPVVYIVPVIFSNYHKIAKLKRWNRIRGSVSVFKKGSVKRTIETGFRNKSFRRKRSAKTRWAPLRYPPLRSKDGPWSTLTQASCVR